MFGVQERLGLGLLLTVNPQNLSVAVRSRAAREKISLCSEVAASKRRFSATILKTNSAIIGCFFSFFIVGSRLLYSLYSEKIFMALFFFKCPFISHCTPTVCRINLVHIQLPVSAVRQFEAKKSFLKIFVLEEVFRYREEMFWVCGRHQGRLDDQATS